MSKIVSEALQDLEGVRVHRLLTYDDLFSDRQDHDVDVEIAAMERDMFGPAILLHSSGNESDHVNGVHVYHPKHRINQSSQTSVLDTQEGDGLRNGSMYVCST